MLAVIYHTLREAAGRRMGIALLVVAALTSIVYVTNIRFAQAATGEIMVQQGPNSAPVEMFVRFNYPSQINFSGLWWLILGVVASAPLLTSFLESGWHELQLTKGVARWQMLLGRYVGALLLFTASLIFFHVVPALHVWLGTGYPPWGFLLAVLLVLLSFASLLALMTVIAASQPNPHPGYPMIAGLSQIVLSRLLADPTDLYNTFTNFREVAPLFTAIHGVLPRNTELLWAGIDLVHSGRVESWAPVWATLAFTVVALALACAILHRRSL